MMVNGNTWPFLNVEQRRYRFRFLNACNARALILKLDRDGLPFWQIGSDGGFLPRPARLTQLLIAPAERADVIVDFTRVPVGTTITLLNIGPDSPFGGGVPGVDFPVATRRRRVASCSSACARRDRWIAVCRPTGWQLPSVPGAADNASPGVECR